MFGAIAAIIGALASASAQNDANNTQKQALIYQQQRDREMNRQAQATRVDAYGNTLEYNSALNTWEIVLTPEQKAITDAMQQQQLLSQTEDANRARELRRRQEPRSIQADELYKQAVLDYEHGPDQPRDRRAYDVEAAGDIVRATDEQQAGPRADVAKLALRTGQGANLNSLLQGIGSGSGSPGLGAAILAGKEKGGQNYQTALGNKYAKLGGPIATFEKIADDISGYTDLQSDSPGKLGATESEVASAIQSALKSGASGVGSAYDSLAKSLGTSVDFSGIVSAMMGLDKQFNKDGSSLTASIAQPGSTGGSGGIFAPSSSVADRTGTPFSSSSGYGTTYGPGGGFNSPWGTDWWEGA